jgi:hypothetical protein
MIDAEFDRLLGEEFPHHRWRAALGIAVTVMIGWGVFSWIRTPAPTAQTVCDQLATPGLTTGEGRDIVVHAQREGISTDDLRRHCASLVDGFAP